MTIKMKKKKNILIINTRNRKIFMFIENFI